MEEQKREESSIWQYIPNMRSLNASIGSILEYIYGQPKQDSFTGLIQTHIPLSISLAIFIDSLVNIEFALMNREFPNWKKISYTFVGATFNYGIRNIIKDYVKDSEYDELPIKVGGGFIAGAVKYSIRDELSLASVVIGGMNTALYEYVDKALGEAIEENHLINIFLHIYQIESFDVFLDHFIFQQNNLGIKILFMGPIFASANIAIFISEKEIYSLSEIIKMVWSGENKDEFLFVDQALSIDENCVNVENGKIIELYSNDGDCSAWKEYWPYGAESYNEAVGLGMPHKVIEAVVESEL